MATVFIHTHAPHRKGNQQVASDLCKVLRLEEGDGLPKNAKDLARCPPIPLARHTHTHTYGTHTVWL